MANHKSAEKRARQTKIRNERNSFVRKTMRSYIKRVRVAVESEKKSEATEALKAAVKQIDRAASKNVIHNNKAARSISRLTRLVNKLEASE